jgi:hypothetical protein
VGTKEKNSKSVTVYHAAPRACYDDYSTFDGANFSDVDLGGRATMHIEESAKYLYLGSIIHRDGTDTFDVDARIRSAKGAFGALLGSACSRARMSHWTLEGKRAVYTVYPHPLCASLLSIVYTAVDVSQSKEEKRAYPPYAYPITHTHTHTPDRLLMRASPSSRFVYPRFTTAANQ